MRPPVVQARRTRRTWRWRSPAAPLRAPPAAPPASPPYLHDPAPPRTAATMSVMCGASASLPPARYTVHRFAVGLGGVASSQRAMPELTRTLDSSGTTPANRVLHGRNQAACRRGWRRTWSRRSNSCNADCALPCSRVRSANDRASTSFIAQRFSEGEGEGLAELAQTHAPSEQVFQTHPQTAGSLQGVPPSCCGRRVAVWSGACSNGPSGFGEAATTR